MITKVIAIQHNLVPPITVDPSWLKLIAYVSAHPFSTLTITFRDGNPHLAEEIKESIKF